MSDSPSVPARAAFGYRDFRLYQAARFLQVVGLEMQSVAIGWQVYALSNDPLALGYVGLSQFLPFILLSLVGGHTADRYDRRKVLAVCMAGQAACSAALLALTVGGNHRTWPIYVVMIGFGAVRAFSMPSSQALLPLLVPRHHFANAVTWGSTVRQIAVITGPTVGGLIYAWGSGAAAVYATAGALVTVALLCVWRIHARALQLETKGISWGTLLAGFAYVWRQRLLLGSISMDLFAVLLGGAVALLPVFARDILHVGAEGLGVLRSAPAIGAATMAVLLAFFPLRRKAGVIMLACVALFGVATIVFGLSRNFLLSVAALAVLGAADMVSMVVRLTLEQIATPEDMRGRVGAVNGMFIGASNELGEFESGLTASLFGTVPAVIIGGTGTLIVVAIWSVLFPELRKVDRL